jgi:hypothetical protein
VKRLFVLTFALTLLVAAMFAPASASASGGSVPHITVVSQWAVPHADGFTYYEATVAADPTTHLYGTALYSGVEYTFDFVATPTGYVIPPFRTSGGLLLQSIDLRSAPSSQPFMTQDWDPSCGQQAIRWEYLPFFSTKLYLVYTNQSGINSLTEVQRVGKVNGWMSVNTSDQDQCASSAWHSNRMPTY